MKIPFNKKWVVWEKEDYANYLFVVPAWEGFTHKNTEFEFDNCNWLSAEYIDKECNLFSPLDVIEKLSKKYLESIFTKPDVWDKLHKENIFYAKELIKLADQIKKINTKNLTNTQISNWLNKLIKIEQENHDRRGIMFTIEVKYNLFSNYLMEYLKERCKDNKLSISAMEAFRILTTSTNKSFIKKQQEDLISIAMIKSKEKQNLALKSHAKKYEWLEYGLQGKILNEDYFKKELLKLKRRNIKKLAQNAEKEISEIKDKQKIIIKKLKIHQHHQRLFKIARDSIFLKAFSKDAQFYSYYATENLFKELAFRGKLTLEQVKFLTLSEYQEVLSGKDFSNIANSRMKYSIHFSNKGKTIIYQGAKAKQIRKKINLIKEQDIISKSLTEIKGNSAYPGRVVGKVKIINSVQEMMKMHQGDVLVSHMTNPDIVPAMKQASAIVTDLGGITCHAAIVSRELKIPCVIGTKIATQVLKDGDKVEVDANKGIVKILK